MIGALWQNGSRSYKIWVPRSALEEAYASVPGLNSDGKGCAGLLCTCQSGALAALSTVASIRVDGACPELGMQVGV